TRRPTRSPSKRSKSITTGSISSSPMANPYRVPGVYYEPQPRQDEVPFARTDVVGFIGFEPRVRESFPPSRLTGTVAATVAAALATAATALASAGTSRAAALAILGAGVFAPVPAPLAAAATAAATQAGSDASTAAAAAAAILVPVL